jgi:hypothetical protein
MMTFSEALLPLVVGILLYGAALAVWRWCLSPKRPTDLQAEKRAKLLLGEFLTDEEHRQLTESGYLEVRSPSVVERVYRIREEGQSVDMYDSGILSMRMRSQPSQEIPAGDLILMHKFMIEGSEKEYLRSANVRWQRSIKGDGEHRWSHKPNGRRLTKMLARLDGGVIAKGGCYWSMKDGEFVSIPKEGGMLEGGSERKYVKVPVPLVLILGPVMGVAFAMFLPISGVLVLVPFIAGKLRRAVSSGRVSAAHMASLQMKPGTSYLGPSGGPATSGEDTEPVRPGGEEDGKLHALAAEIAEKRWRER